MRTSALLAPTNRFPTELRSDAKPIPFHFSVWRCTSGLPFRDGHPSSAFSLTSEKRFSYMKQDSAQGKGTTKCQGQRPFAVARAEGEKMDQSINPQLYGTSKSEISEMDENISILFKVAHSLIHPL
jgi:hypothetical protein